MRSTILGACAAAGLMMSGSAFAQSPTAPAGAAPSSDKAVLSKSCSQQADAKGLHGKARKHFRSQCKHGH